MSWLPIPRPLTKRGIATAMLGSDHVMQVLKWLWSGVDLQNIAALLEDLDKPETRRIVKDNPAMLLHAHHVVASPGTTIAITEPLPGCWRIEATGAKGKRMYRSGFDSDGGFFMNYTRRQAA